MKRKLSKQREDDGRKGNGSIDKNCVCVWGCMRQHRQRQTRADKSSTRRHQPNHQTDAMLVDPARDPTDWCVEKIGATLTNICSDAISAARESYCCGRGFREILLARVLLR